mgnify:CR=1 FL=1
MRIDVLTLFPEMFPGVLGASIIKRAAAAGAVTFGVHDIRQWTVNKHGKVDAPPFGGGPGMVMQCQPVWDALEAVRAMDAAPPLPIVLTPQGQPLTQPRVEQLAALPRLLLVCGHYEGIDERVLDRLRDEGDMLELSIGDYVLSGGEVAAMVVIDAVVRLLPGVLGDATSAHHESFASGAGGQLDYPHYAKPRQWDGRDVPDVLLSGDHAKIAAWRAEQSRLRTAQRRPDLVSASPL